MTDPIVDAVCDKFQARSAIGIKKYGTTLADSNAPMEERLTHLQEELMDAVLYMQRLKEEITTMKEEMLLRDIENMDIYGIEIVEPDNGFWVSNTTNTHLNLRNDNSKD